MHHRVASIFPIIDEISNPGEVLDVIGVANSKVYKTCPAKCPICESNAFATLELVGINSKPLFWECEACEALFCMKERSDIEKMILATGDMWTNPGDWNEPERDQFN